MKKVSLAFILLLFFAYTTVAQQTFTDENYGPFLYTGQLKDGKPEGLGTATFTKFNGSTYQGYFTNGKFGPFGTLTLNIPKRPSIFYIGEFKDGLFHGMGKLIALGVEEYIGQFQEGKKSGAGSITYMIKDGGKTATSTVISEFDNNQPKGLGIYSLGLLPDYVAMGEFKGKDPIITGVGLIDASKLTDEQKQLFLGRSDYDVYLGEISSTKQKAMIPNGGIGFFGSKPSQSQYKLGKYAIGNIESSLLSGFGMTAYGENINDFRIGGFSGFDQLVGLHSVAQFTNLNDKSFEIAIGNFLTQKKSKEGSLGIKFKDLELKEIYFGKTDWDTKTYSKSGLGSIYKKNFKLKTTKNFKE